MQVEPAPGVFHAVGETIGRATELIQIGSGSGQGRASPRKRPAPVPACRSWWSAPSWRRRPLPAAAVHRARPDRGRHVACGGHLARGRCHDVYIGLRAS